MESELLAGLLKFGMIIFITWNAVKTAEKCKTYKERFFVMLPVSVILVVLFILHLMGGKL